MRSRPISAREYADLCEGRRHRAQRAIQSWHSTAKQKDQGRWPRGERMLGATPEGRDRVRQMKDRVIADFDVTEKMLRYFSRAHNREPRLQGEAASDCLRPVGHHRSGEAPGARLRSWRRRKEVSWLRADGCGDRRRLPVETRRQHGDRHRRRHYRDRVIALSGIVSDTSIRTGGDELDMASPIHAQELQPSGGESTAER